MAPQGLVEGWLEGQRAWPRVSVTQEEFAAYVDTHAAGGGNGGEAGASQQQPRKWRDLYLACACARGDAAALQVFETAFFGEVDAAAKKIGGASLTADELRQVLRDKLFVAEPSTPPKITEYSGRGDLRAWVRVTALRTAMNIASRAAREMPFERDALTFLIGSGDDLELSYLKRAYAHQFRLAFVDAFQTLQSKDRNLLRYAFGDRLTVDAIGALYSVHRATAARWVTQAHEKLTVEVKKALVGRLGIKNRDYASVLRMIQSQLTITLDRYLKGT